MKTKALVFLAFLGIILLPQYAFADLSFSYTSSTQAAGSGNAAVVDTALTQVDTSSQAATDSNSTTPVSTAPVNSQAPSTPVSTQAPSTPDFPTNATASPVASSNLAPQTPPSTPPATQAPPTSSSHFNGSAYQKSDTAPQPFKTAVQQWVNDKTSDSQFLQSMRQFVNHDSTPIQVTGHDTPIPSWIKDDASLWSSGRIDYNTFVTDVQYWMAHDNVPAPARVPYVIPQPQQETMQDATATGVTPNSATVQTGTPVTFTATVTDTSSMPTTPSGIVSWNDGNSGGTFSSATCSIYEGTCTVTYTPPLGSRSLTITAGYGGDSIHQSSYGTASLLVEGQVHNTSVTVTPNTTTFVAGSAMTLTATIGDASYPAYALTGTVSWSDNGAGGTFSPSTCVVSDNSCSVAYTPPSISSDITIAASYGGDESDYGSSGTTVLAPDGVASTATSNTMNVQTDQSSYSPGNNVTITTYPAGAQAGQTVAIVVSDPSLNIVASRTAEVGTQGDAVLQIGLSPDAVSGSYQVTATALVGGNDLKGTAEFTVSGQAAQPSGISIVSIQPTDQEGNNAVTSYGKGTTGYAKIVLSSASSQQALVTIDLAGPDGTSLGVGSVKTSLGAGESQMIVSFYVPSDAAVGTGNLYADMFSDWPSNGGVPLTTESSDNVVIS